MSDATAAIIVAAGRGTRLRPLTDNCPKCLLRLTHETILERMLKCLISYEVQPIVVAVGYMADKVQKCVSALKNTNEANLKIAFNKDYHQTEATYSIHLAMKQIEGQKSVLIVDGDLVIDNWLVDKVLRTKGSSALVDLSRAPTDEDAKVKLSEGRIVDVGKHIKKNEAGGVWVGMARLTGAFMHYFIEQVSREDLWKDWWSEPLRCVMRREPLQIVETEGRFWTEVDTLQDLIVARNHCEKEEQGLGNGTLS
ncbi:MAG: hypothetical protein DRN95_04845 [Candidatus Hydrothermarchaeota archaeon]|nr:MAG: hypothetical protein DRN95_04845 [Candidatus Hydrothermarchaeota archaeon]